MADERWTLDQRTPEQPTGVAKDLIARVQELEEQLAAAQDQALRVVAGLQDIRRRAKRGVKKAYKFALGKLAGDLLTVVDALERGLEMSDPNDEAIKPMRERMELTLKMFDDILRHYQAGALSPGDEPFNPEQYQAVTMRESASVGPGGVLKVFQKGYLPNGRLLRPAMVVISKAPAKTPPSVNKQAWNSTRQPRPGSQPSARPTGGSHGIKISGE